MLITPATTVARYPKAHQTLADICAVDLEDSVPAAEKEKARSQAEGFFTAPSAGSRRCAVRLNAVTEPDGLRDLLKLSEYRVKPSIVLVPKVEAARDIEIVEEILAGCCPSLEIFAVVETPRGLENAAAIATASHRLRALVFGSADYAFAVGARRTWEALLSARAYLVNSARAADVEAIDAPWFAISDLPGLRWEAAKSKDLGFSGKVAIHPSQVEPINRAFSPESELLEQARKIVAAGSANTAGIAVVDGVMAGRPFFESSQRLLREFGTPEERLSPNADKGSD